MKTLFKEGELPMQTFEKLGLLRNREVNLEDEDLAALLSGRRTDHVTIKNLRSDDFHIAELDARLSLFRNGMGEVALRIHPIYKEARKHPLLSDDESEKLISGKVSHQQVEINEAGEKKKRVIEYDAATREFIEYDPEKVIAPDKVNGFELSDKQKNSFRLGDLIHLPDGTGLQHRASDRQGILSDSTILVLSVLLDGGVLYLLYRGLNNLFGATSSQKNGQQSAAYEAAVKEMERNRSAGYNNQLEQGIHSFQQSRGYGRNASR